MTKSAVEKRKDAANRVDRLVRVQTEVAELQREKLRLEVEALERKRRADSANVLWRPASQRRFG